MNKNFLLFLLFAFTSQLAFGQPATPSFAPLCPQAEVISLFSDSYADVPVDTWLTPWSQPNPADPGGTTNSVVSVGGNDVQFYENVGFFGIETVSNQIDATGMTTFNFDFWTPNINTFKVKLVDFGPNGIFQGGDDTEHELTFTPTQSGWNTYSIPLSDFIGLTSTPANIAQLIFVSDDPFNTGTMALDNVYFSTSNCVTSSPAPTCDPSQVISMFSNAPDYNDVLVDTWLTPWSQPNPADPGGTTNSVVSIGGNDMQFYENVGFFGIETVTNQIDVTGMTTFHFDVWTPNITSLKVKLVDFGPNGIFQGGDDTEHELTLTTTINGWNSFEIPLSNFTGLTATPTNIAQLIFVSDMPFSTGTMYLDNVYFSSCPAGADITFCVDMSCFDNAPQVPSVFGFFNGWCANCDLLTEDPANPGIYCATVRMPAGEQQFKFFDQIEMDEQFTTFEAGCHALDGDNINRVVTVVPNVPQTLTFGWNSCNADCVAPLPPPSFPITFDDAVNFSLIDFGDPATTISDIANDPEGGANQVLCIRKPADAPTWAGTVVGNNGITGGIPFTATNQIMIMDVWSPAAGIPVLLKVENAQNSNIASEVEVATTVAMGWETLVFDFSANGAPPVDLAQVYDKIVIFPNFGNTGEEVKLFFDNIAFDSEAPVLVCPANTTINLGGGECGAAGGWILPTATDNSGVVTLTQTNPVAGTIIPIGTTTVTYEAVDAGGNSATCTFDVIVEEFPNPITTLACNGNVNFSVDASCTSVVSADMILEGGPYGCYDNYIVSIDGGNNIVNPSMIGLTLEVTVTGPNGETCWGYITIEDKLGPTIDCMDMTISCDDALPGAPIATDACGTVAVSMVSETVVDNGCAGMFSEVITRVWEASDGFGNSVSCTQVISRTRATLADVVLPANHTTDCANHEDDVFQNTNPQDSYTFTTNPALVGKLVSGEPTGAGCDNLIIHHTDEIVTICAGSYKVLRHWTITDWCAPVGNNILTATQIVKIEDTTGPIVATVGNVTVGANSAGCGGVFVAPALGADDCSGVASSTFSVGGTALVTGSSVPVGVHIIDYVVTDGCDNSTTGSYQLTVVDNFAPVAICDEHTVASIGSPSPGITGDGTVTIPAATFDDGSYDNCGQVWFKVRRMTINGCNGLNGDDAPTPPFFFYPGYQEWFDDAASFCCQDDVVMVIFRVYDVDPGDGPVEDARHNVGGDLYGRYNDCMVEVEVQDKLAPVIICAPDKTINCDEDTSVAALGDADAFDNCSVVSVTNSEIDLTNDCGEGLILRTFVATDAAGNTNSCTQRITLINEDPFEIVDTECWSFGGIQGFENGQPIYGNNILINGNPQGPNSRLDDVEWPCDIELTTCGLGLDPDDLDADYPRDARPAISENACGNIGVGHEDLTLPVQGDACIKILRKWTIIDWCQYSVGNALGNGIWEYVQVIKVVNSQAPNVNCGNSDSFIQNFEENCGATFVNLFIDADDDCTPQGDLTYSYEVENGNGTVIQTGTTNNASDAFNNGTYKVTWTVADGCGNEQVCVHDFTVVDAKKPTPVCISGLATVIMPSSGAVTIWASDFESGSSFDNCTPYSGLQFSFSSDVTDTDMEFTCAMISSSNTVPVEIWVTDGSGNQDFCVTYIVVQDPNGACGTTQTGALPTGSITTEAGQDIELVNVELMGSNEPMIVTGANGQFDFGQMPVSTTPYVITPEKNINPTNGVTTFDLVLISQHILGTNPITTGYKMIAADANNSETITTFDIVVLRRLILQIDSQFPGTQKSWRFVDAAHSFASVTTADVFPFPETIVADANGGHNFIGVKIGDLNGSANVDELLGTSDTRTFDGDLVFQLEDKQVKAGEEFTVDFRAKDFNNTLGYQFTLGFDNDKVEFVDLATNLTKMDEGNFGLTMLEEGVITTSWNSHEAVDVANDETVFSLTFTANEAVSVSEILNINSRYTVAEAYNGSDLYDVAIAFDGQVVASDFALYQNTPNPFKDVTTIGFNLPTATTATLRVYDVSGKVLTLVEVEGAKGYNSVELNRSQLAATGVLYYQVETADHTATLKMILVD